MDYGKLAYVKVEELESRLSAMMPKGKNLVNSVTITPVYDLNLGDYEICELFASGHITATLKVTIRADEETHDEPVDFKVNGVLASRTYFTAKAGERVETLIVSGAFVDGNATLSIGCRALSTLIRVQVVVSGESVSLRSYGGESAVDKSGETWVAVKSASEQIYAIAFTEENPDFSSPVYIGTGSKADVCALKEGGFIIAYVDEAKNAVIAITTKDLAPIEYKVIDTAVTDVAVSTYGTGVVIAVLKEGKVYSFITCGNALSQIMPECTEIVERVSGIAFVKNAPTPMLMVETVDNRTYLKTSKRYDSAGDKISLKISFNLVAEGY